MKNRAIDLQLCTDKSGAAGAGRKADVVMNYRGGLGKEHDVEQGGGMEQGKRRGMMRRQMGGGGGGGGGGGKSKVFGQLIQVSSHL